MKRNYFLLIALCLWNAALAENDSLLLQRLKHHIYYLADDSLEGRATGSKGEQIAYRYIADQFKNIDIVPYQANSFIQPFDYFAGRQYGENNALTINGRQLTLDKDFYPLGFTANSTITGEAVFVGYGIQAKEIKHDDYRKKKNLEGKIFIIDISSPEGDNPHSDFYHYLDLKTKTSTAIRKGAAAVVFVSNHPETPSPEPQYNKNIYPVDIPVVFVKDHIWSEYKNLKKLQISLSADLLKIQKKAHNVVGFIDNNAANTIVLGAHYDHLGWGESGGSLYRGEPAIHNGADDNASGVALIMELARELQNSTLNENNYLFIAFSGEELGLFGSNYFVNQTGFPHASVNYMLNFDMVGRLHHTEKSIQISGFGTSSAWKILDKITIDSIKITKDEGGIGPSDHTSFYLKDIPVLHFFTGAHEDYHKPSDDPEFVNYHGIVSIFNLTLALIDSLNNRDKLDFIKVQEDSVKQAPRFTVTLGIIPNYMYNEEGVKVDGVSDGKPAAQAGIQAGDVIIQMGEVIISDFMAYMHALSTFKKGDTTQVKVKRDEQLIEFNVTF